MLLVVINLSMLVFSLILLLFYHTAKRHDRKKRRLDAIQISGRLIFDEEIEKPFFERVIVPMAAAIIRFMSNLLPKKKGDKSQKLEKTLRMAGLKLDINEYNAVKLIFSGGCVGAAVLISILTGVSAPGVFLLVLVGFNISLITPIYYLRIQTRKRQSEIKNQLPDVIDLLCVSIEAGLSFDSALGRINERLSGILVDELNFVLTEIQLGTPRRIALKNLIDRSSVEELNHFISAVIQSDQLGISIKNVLYSQAQQIRNNRRQKAEEQAMKAPVKMMIPLLVFVFPVLFIVLLGPTVINLIQQFGS